MQTMVRDDGMDVVGQILQRAAQATKGAQPIHIMPPGSGGTGQQQIVNSIARPSWMGAVGTPQGISMPTEELDPLPFDPVILTNTNLNDKLISFPQRPGRNERLVMSAIFTPSGGSPVDGAIFVVIDPAMFCGATQIGQTQGSMPITAFSAQAFGVRLSFPHSGQGTRIVIPVRSLIALASGDKLVVTALMIGSAVR
jgi:hypothetical protein